MDVFRIKGGAPLSGSVTVSGAKNAALPIFAATLLTDQECTIENVPDLSDVRFMARILEHLGSQVKQLDRHTWQFKAPSVTPVAPYDLVRKMRASVCLLGPLVARCRKADVSLPGGCVIGPRPIDLHLKGLRKLGCEIRIERGYVRVDASHLNGNYVYLGGRHGSTVTGTANIVMAAVKTPGITRIESAACEPEVVDLCQMLVQMGAHIDGIGSHYLKITGTDQLRGVHHRIISDRIEAGTLMAAAAITRGEVTIQDVIPGHMRALLDKLDECGIALSVDPDNRRITVHGDQRERNPVEIVTLAHPGFPTDLQAQMTALMAITPGLSIITEKIYPNRFMHVPELLRMGANIAVEGMSSVINGRPRLSGAPVMASDLRASAALILAGLAAEGETWVQRIYHLDRGYESFEKKLVSLGAGVDRLPDSELPSGMELS